jgi:anti-anti-sigma regulatory factor
MRRRSKGKADGSAESHSTDSSVELTMTNGRPALRGSCSLSNVSLIQELLGAFENQAVEIDLSGVTFFDAAALRAFHDVRLHNPHLRFVEPSDAVLLVLDLTGTRDYLLADA